jgi:bifunctional enzyme CysN/CysC
MTDALSTPNRERLNIVVIGHVDHGKSTVVGRLLADTGSLPEGKLEQVRAACARTARPFEYAFLLDALKNEQSQGITIDAARCFFRTARRDYILHDAPGHIEFLKNMVTGAARGEAALIVIDAKDGICENSRRHGYMTSMLGLRQVAVLVNKMDLVAYDRTTFDRIAEEYTRFLAPLGVRPVGFVPVAAVHGVNMTVPPAAEMPWYSGPTVLGQIEAFVRPPPPRELPFRFPVQDIYKFTESGDDRRVIAGTVDTGEVRPGDPVVFFPSGKHTTVRTIEVFNRPAPAAAAAGEAVGFTMTTQVYAKPGELLCRADQPPPRVGTRFRANLFWMGRNPLVPNRAYKLKLGAARVQVRLVSVLRVLDAAETRTVQAKPNVERHDVAECLLETARPLAFDLRADIEPTGRFVIVDTYDIAGCGVILDAAADPEAPALDHVRQREFAWERGMVTPGDRELRNRHQGKFVVVAGSPEAGTHDVARLLEREMFRRGCQTYYLAIRNLAVDLDSDSRLRPLAYDEHVRQLGELARLLTEAGLMVVTTLADADDYDLEVLRLLNSPYELFLVTVGDSPFTRVKPELALPSGVPPRDAFQAAVVELTRRDVLPDWVI